MHNESYDALKDIKKHAKQKRLVFVSGNFNIIHPGHLRLLRFASECGDFLVVGVLDSSSKGAIVKENFRLEGIGSLSWVDYSFILREPTEVFIEKLKPDFVVKGKEHEERNNPEADVLLKTGGKLLFGSGDISFSSVDLLRKEFREFNIGAIKKPVDFQKRHGFNMEEMKDILGRMNGLKVCVIGDVIVDKYITCDPLGMSQEDPTIVVTPVHNKKFIGGAGIVAAHARSLGAEVHFFTVVGKDATADFVYDSIKESSVELHAYVDESRPTTLKERYRAGQKTLLKVSHLRQHAIGAEIRKKMADDIIKIIKEIDVLIFADFNYGCLPQTLVDMVSDVCLKHKILLSADSQSSSQIGDISRFNNMTLITPTEREARLAVHDYDSGLVVLAEKLMRKCNAKNVIVTLGAEGILIHPEIDINNKWPTDRIPSMNTSPKDIAGAGDSLLTCASMALASGADIWQSSYLGSVASACQVGRIGNIPLTTEELNLELSD